MRVDLVQFLGARLRGSGLLLAGASASVKSDPNRPRCLALHFWI
jgi:hypothetical protein